MARTQSGGGSGDLHAATDALLSAWEDSPRLEVVHVRRLPAESGAHAVWPAWVHQDVRRAFVDAGVSELWAHQHAALTAVREGRDVVIATATASGKSLCYQVPILDAIARDPHARALALFPTKALARDQVAGMRERLGHALAIGAGVFDGDTPPDERRAVRDRAHIVASNPDMLHRSILPHHDRWAGLLSRLRYVVIDELHVYRGLFGSHVANVLRRLMRVCASYGARPVVIACSATIGNPAELAATLTGRSALTLIDKSTAPRPPRTIVVLNPAVTDAVTGVRADFVKVARAVAGDLRRERVGGLVFCRTRKTVELLTRYVREDDVARACGRGPAADEFGDPPQLGGPTGTFAATRAAAEIRGYRSGYLPAHRRDVERALRSGEAELVAATSALELGIDVGGIDAVVLVGYPGTRASSWQRLGRAGRRGRAALGVLVLSSAPLDQRIADAPEFLFDAPIERARIDPDNPEVLVPHLRCAAFERPLSLDEPFAASAGPGGHGGGGDDAWIDVLTALEGCGQLVRRETEDGPRWYAVGAGFPADGVDLRGTLEEDFEVIEEIEGSLEHGRVLAQVDFEDGPLYLHPGAIHQLEGRTYEVRALDWEGRKAYVRAVAAAYYTEAVSHVRTRVIDPLHADARGGWGYAQVVRAVPAFKKLRLSTHDTIGMGPVQVPDLDWHTCCAWWRLPDRLLAAWPDGGRRLRAARAVAHALHHAAAMLTMCDVSDLGVALGVEPERGGWAVLAGRSGDAELDRIAAGAPSVLLFDRVPGGAGLSLGAAEREHELLALARSLATACRCARGCLTCAGTAAADEPQARHGEDVQGSLRADLHLALDLLADDCAAAARSQGSGGSARACA